VGDVAVLGEEIWDPVVNRTNIEIQVQVEREAPAVVPGDRLIPGRPRGQRGGG
jgi:hypothetical protein